jgi:hypothetical protein
MQNEVERERYNNLTLSIDLGPSVLRMMSATALAAEILPSWACLPVVLWVLESVRNGDGCKGEQRYGFVMRRWRVREPRVQSGSRVVV